MSSSKTVRLCLVSWLRSQKSTKPKLCKSLACASSTKSKPLGNLWKIFDFGKFFGSQSLASTSDILQKKAIWFDNNCWERKKTWIYRSSSCVAIGQSASLVAPLTCWWRPKPDSTIKKGNKCRELTCQDVFSQWASQTSTNATRAPQPLVNNGRLAAATLRIDPSTRLQRFHATWPATYVEPTNIRAFLTMTLKNKGKHKHDFKLMNSKLVLPSITCDLFVGKQSPPATCTYSLLILNQKTHTIAGNNHFHQTKMLMEGAIPACPRSSSLIASKQHGFCKETKRFPVQVPLQWSRTQGCGDIHTCLRISQWYFKRPMRIPITKWIQKTLKQSETTFVAASACACAR